MKDLEDLIKEELQEVEETYESLYVRTKTWLKANYKNILVSIALLASGFILGALVVDKMKQEVITEKIVYRDNPKDVVMSKNWFTQDLDLMKFDKIRVVKSTVTKDELVGVWRRMEDKDGFAAYVAIFEPVDNLKYNIKEFADYNKKESENALKVK